MSKFKIKLELQAFKLEIEGSREDIPLITQNVAKQLTGLVQPPQGIVGTAPSPSTNGDDGAGQMLVNGKPYSKSKPRKPSKQSSPQKTESQIIDFQPDPLNFGTPLQTWNTVQKAIWLMLLLKQEKSLTHSSPTLIAETFNKHFFTAGVLRPSNVSRDLKANKGSKDSWVGETDSGLFLTDAGAKKAAELIV